MLLIKAQCERLLDNGRRQAAVKDRTANAGFAELIDVSWLPFGWTLTRHP